MGSEPLREFDLIRWIQRETPADGRVLIGIGDDCALVANRGPSSLITTDMLVDRVHFDLREATPRQVGWKAMACSVSDIAAMGGRSLAAVVSCALPRGFSADDAHELVRGLLDCAGEFDICLVGGDLTGTDGPLVINVALLGDTGGRPPVRRSGARPGDALLVTGALGGSLLGRHLCFRPRQAEGLILNEQYALHAMMDISDGLAIDLHHILDESSVGARVWAAQVPISEDARRAAERSGRSPLDHALGDGEDYELLFTMDEASAGRLLAERPFETPVTRIGSITETVRSAGLSPCRAFEERPEGRTTNPRSGALLVLPDGAERPLERKGWEHTV